MSQSLLTFDDEDHEFEPAATRTAPSFFIRRLVVFNLNEDETERIRDVEFKLGLNIINTAPPDPDKDGAVGHDVGKTLLTRLIRYCLGETNFGKKRTRNKIAVALPESFVALELTVGTEDWTVVRPLGATGTYSYKAVRDKPWQMAVHEPSDMNQSQFADLLFAETLGTSEPNEAFQVTMPKADRPIRWLDLLAWLSRDQNCRYRRPLEWRSEFSESNTKNLKEVDASVLVRCMMGLLDETERKLIVKHHNLLRKQSAKESEIKRLESSTDQVRSFLERRLGLDPGAVDTNLFASTAIAELQRQREAKEVEALALELEHELESVYQTWDDAKSKRIRKERDVEMLGGEIKTREDRLVQIKNQTDKTIKKSLALRADVCSNSMEDCPVKRAKFQNDFPKHARDHAKDQVEEELAELKPKLADVEIELKSLESKEQSTKASYDKAKQGLAEAVKSINKEIAKIDAQIEEAESFTDDRTALEKATDELVRLESKITRSRDVQKSEQKGLAERHQRLNAHLRRVFFRLTQQSSDARLQLNLNGIRIIAGEDESDPGEAMASETALAFDLACLSASICGLGVHPRFMIHDSPREGDLEPHIYHRLFRFIARLESDHGTNPINFQYIIATTTPPPEDLGTSASTVLTLDARKLSGLLLLTSF
ncbi:hypothetical protein [Aporhodopirellula aestuarii]|uniref:Uncharacterized protein n=1 Tax=Aporhodopirellula aestuarii TaxID=2950107 RepID=A0ABT0U155_9BACT|nr:hypothetical protein [Aporhodopirellula aestuarii]MCM2370625.1 hypothetical protein [Aporhodopirellula aestuarii]